MYVAQRVDDPSTLAIAIRGTNFFSVLDWLSNLPLEPRPWEYGGAGPEVKISLSTWFGLRLLQRLQSGPVPAPPADETPAEKLQAAETSSQAALIYVLIKNILQGATEVDAAGYLSKIKDGIGSVATTFLQGHDPRLAHAVADAGQAAPQSNTLIDFLTSFMKTAAAPVNIHVTGHSKSGALAPALALWLADTQGTSVATQQWDPRAMAKLHLYTFAAPTPGNAGFAAHFKASAIVDAYRLANPYDIVAHVWAPDEVRQIPGLYGDQLTSLRIPLDLLAEALRIFGYQHELASKQWIGGAMPQANFLQRAGVEHLDAYLKELGLFDANTLSTLALFAPISTE